MISYILYGAESSYYSGKIRSYLLHKRIPFREKSANGWDYLVYLPRKVGVAVLPVLLTPQGEWIQDSSVIMDVMEARFPTPSALPETPVLRFAAYLFELWGDEFLLPLAMHTRWNRPEQRDWVIDQFGAQMLPGWPRPFQRALGNKVARTMNAYRRTVGFNIEMGPVLDRFGQIQLDALDAHFAEHRFLFGNRPCYGDYGLIGPLYAHIGRDPLAKRDLIDVRPHLSAWISRMFQPDTSAGGEFRVDDTVPATLLPALRSMIDEMLPFLKACAAQASKTPVLPANTTKPQRFLGNVSYPMAAGVHTRAAVPYVVWEGQRMLNVFKNMSAAGQTSVRDWLQSIGGEDLLKLDLPPMRRVALGAAHVAATDAN
jgi:glutathione S-transferase